METKRASRIQQYKIRTSHLTTTAFFNITKSHIPNYLPSNPHHDVYELDLLYLLYVSVLPAETFTCSASKSLSPPNRPPHLLIALFVTSIKRNPAIACSSTRDQVSYNRHSTIENVLPSRPLFANNFQQLSKRGVAAAPTSPASSRASPRTSGAPASPRSRSTAFSTLLRQSQPDSSVV